MMNDKGWLALGAFDPADRSRALDQLGFAAQLVFSTFAPTQFAGNDERLLFGGARGPQPRDGRLLRRRRALAAGRVRAVGHTRANDRSRRRGDRSGRRRGPRSVGTPACRLVADASRVSPVVGALEERGVPFVLHIGGGGRLTNPAFHRNGIEVTDFLGGGENVRAKDYVGISHAAGDVPRRDDLRRHPRAVPRLRGGSIEQGALWVVPWMKKLDLAHAERSVVPKKYCAISRSNRRSTSAVSSVSRRFPANPSRG